MKFHNRTFKIIKLFPFLMLTSIFLLVRFRKQWELRLRLRKSRPALSVNILILQVWNKTQKILLRELLLSLQCASRFGKTCFLEAVQILVMAYVVLCPLSFPRLPVPFPHFICSSHLPNSLQFSKHIRLSCAYLSCLLA